MERRVEEAELSEFEDAAPLEIEQAELITKGDIDRELHRVELEYRREELEGKRQDRRQRGKFSIWIFIFMGVYMFLTLILLFLSGKGTLSLSDSVLISIMTTTTADVIGVFIIVAKYLFHN